MDALELVLLAKDTIEARKDSNPLLGTIKVVGSIAIGTAAALALAPAIFWSSAHLTG
jgi:hypothetical protein